MKNILYIFGVLFFFFACKKYEDNPKNATMVVKNEYDKDIQVKIFPNFGRPVDTLFFSIKPNETEKKIWVNDSPYGQSEGPFEIRVQPINKKVYFGYYTKPLAIDKPIYNFSITVRTDTILIE